MALSSVARVLCSEIELDSNAAPVPREIAR